jgi:hypothetical protein
MYKFRSPYTSFPPFSTNDLFKALGKGKKKKKKKKKKKTFSSNVVVSHSHGNVPLMIGNTLAIHPIYRKLQIALITPN